MNNCKLFFLTLIMSFISLFVNAQQKARVSGVIEGAADSDSVEIVIDRTFLSRKIERLKIPLTQNKFSADIVLDRNRFIDFNFKSQTIQLYLEPEDNLSLSFKAGNLTGSVVFTEKGSANNKCWKLFSEQFKNDFTDAVMEEKMKSVGIDEFEMQLYSQNKKHNKFIAEYPAKNTLSPTFVKLLDKHVKYNYQHQLLAYPIVNANRSNTILTVNPLPPTIVESIDKKTASDSDAMISDAYRGYLVKFITYFGSELNGFNKFKEYTVSAEKKYVVASDYLKGEPFLFYMAYFLLDAGEKVHPETVKRLYTEMEKVDKKSDYTLLVKENLGKWMKTKLPQDKEGKLDIASADFKIMGVNGKEFSLADFKGKVIYVDFWASWCGPCKQQFPFSKMLHEKLTEKQKKEVVFLYISIDDKEDVWKKAIEANQLGGVHGISPGGWKSFVAKYCQINSIPRYLLIDKKGNVVDGNAKRPSEEETLQDILNLLK